MLPQRNDCMGLYVASAFCHHDRAAAVEKSRHVVLGYSEFIAGLYAPLAKKTSYEYLDKHMARYLENQSNMDFLLNETPSVMVGTPADFFIGVRRLHCILPDFHQRTQ